MRAVWTLPEARLAAIATEAGVRWPLRSPMLTFLRQMSLNTVRQSLARLRADEQYGKYIVSGRQECCSFRIRPLAVALCTEVTVT